MEGNECMQTETKLLTTQEAALLLNIKVSRLRMAVFRKELPYVKIGRLVRFSQSQILQWLDSQTIINKQ
jgi:excisionase family DNA binding protein